jgi:hypothetical protein
MSHLKKNQEFKMADLFKITEIFFICPLLSNLQLFLFLESYWKKNSKIQNGGFIQNVRNFDLCNMSENNFEEQFLRFLRIFRIGIIRTFEDFRIFEFFWEYYQNFAEILEYFECWRNFRGIFMIFGEFLDFFGVLGKNFRIWPIWRSGKSEILEDF